MIQPATGWREGESDGEERALGVPRWFVTLVLAGTVSIVLLVTAFVAKGLYVDWLWFESQGLGSVFLTITWTGLWLFLLVAGTTATLLLGNLFLARALARRRWRAILRGLPSVEDENEDDRRPPRDPTAVLATLSVVSGPSPGLVGQCPVGHGAAPAARQPLRAERPPLRPGRGPLRLYPAPAAGGTHLGPVGRHPGPGRCGGALLRPPGAAPDHPGHAAPAPRGAGRRAGGRRRRRRPAPPQPGPGGRHPGAPLHPGGAPLPDPGRALRPAPAGAGLLRAGGHGGGRLHGRAGSAAGAGGAAGPGPARVAGPPGRDGGAGALDRRRPAGGLRPGLGGGHDDLPLPGAAVAGGAERAGPGAPLHRT